MDGGGSRHEVDVKCDLESMRDAEASKKTGEADSQVDGRAAAGRRER
jgi:hypothetical protein